MPKAICIYIDTVNACLVVDTTHPQRENEFKFGWEKPKKIWDAINDTVPGVICSRVRLVSTDGTPIMSVKERTDAVIIDGLHAMESLAHIADRAISNAFAEREAEVAVQIAELYASGRPIETTGWRG